MSTSINEKALASKLNAIATVKSLAPQVEENAKVQNANNKAISKEVQMSGLAQRLENHFAKLTLVELAEKETFIVLTSKNIPTCVKVCFAKKVNGGYEVIVKNKATLHDESKEDCTEEQIGANTLINGYADKLVKATNGYVKSIMNIAEDWATIYAAALEQRESAKKALWNSWDGIVNGK